MGLETGTFIGDLTITNPPDTDPRSQGAGHLRLIKKALGQSFPGFAKMILSYGVPTGTADVMALTLVPDPLPLAVGNTLLLLPVGPNTTATPNLSTNGGVAVTIVREGEVALQVGDISATPILLTYITSNKWLLLNPAKPTVAITATPGDNDTSVATTAFVTAAIAVAAASASSSAAVNTPPGTVRMSAAAAVDTGWLLCDGTSYLLTDYPALSAKIGTSYGSAGAGTFRVPNFSGRIPLGMGLGSTAEGGGAGTNRVIGAGGGAEAHTISSAEMPSHVHQQQDNAGNLLSNKDTSAGSGSSRRAADPTVQTANGPLSVNSTAATGGGGATNLMNPFLVVSFQIKT